MQNVFVLMNCKKKLHSWEFCCHKQKKKQYFLIIYTAESQGTEALVSEYVRHQSACVSTPLHATVAIMEWKWHAIFFQSWEGVWCSKSAFWSEKVAWFPPGSSSILDDKNHIWILQCVTIAVIMPFLLMSTLLRSLSGSSRTGWAPRQTGFGWYRLALVH